MEPVVHHIEETSEGAATLGRRHSTQWSAVYRNVPVRPEVRIDAGRMTVREFLELEPGAVIPVAKSIDGCSQDAFGGYSNSLLEAMVSMKAVWRSR